MKRWGQWLQRHATRLSLHHLRLTAAVDPDPELRHQPGWLLDADAHPEKACKRGALAKQTPIQNLRAAAALPRLTC